MSPWGPAGRVAASSRWLTTRPPHLRHHFSRSARSVAILKWAVMPLLNRVLAPWLRAHGKDGRLVSVGGAALIVAALLGMALLFRVLSG
jgi:hypothetical protein